VGSGPGSPAGKEVDWLTISNREQSVVDDVKRIRAHPLVAGDIVIHGYVYDVKSGKLIEVPEATAAGKPQS
jgi:carbonic anhydrase